MIQSQFTKFKPFNTEKNRLVRFQCDEQIEEQPDSPWLSLPDEISCAILYQCSLESYCNVKRVCKQLNKLADRRVEYYAYENSLKGCTSQKSNDMLKWWYNTLKLVRNVKAAINLVQALTFRKRAYSFNDPTLLTEYFDGDVTSKDIVAFCKIEMPLARAQSRKRPRQELESIIAFDADAILQYFIEIFEEEFKDDEPSKWRLMMEPKFHNFLWCLLVAFEEHLDPSTEIGKKFPTMSLWPVFMSIMSKYSPAVVRLLVDNVLLKKEIVLLKTPADVILRGLAAHSEIYPLDLTSTLTVQDEISAPNSFCLSPLLLSCYLNNYSMFEELAKHTPFIPSDGYFAALALSPVNSGQQFQIYDELVEKNIDINAKIPTNLKSSTSHPWIETVLAILCFKYGSYGINVYIGLLYHGARFSENELKMLNGSDFHLRPIVRTVLEVSQKGKNPTLFKEVIEWYPKPDETYRNVSELGHPTHLTFSEDDNFSIQDITNATHFGNWKRGSKSNHIICTATRKEEQYLTGSYGDGDTYLEDSASNEIFEFFAYKGFDGRLILLQEDASDLTPSMVLLNTAWVQIIESEW